MFHPIKNATGMLAVFSFLSALGYSAIYVLYHIFSFGVINSSITSVIDTIYNIMFDSFNLLGFFIRPETIRLTALLFVSYYILSMTFKFFMVTIRVAHHLYDRILSFSNKLIGFFVKLFSAFLI